MAGVRDSEDEEPKDDSGTARLLMVAVLVLAVTATVVLVLSNSAQMLRLGVLAALWAALLGVFLANKFRKVVAEKENEVADLQSVYELELEREVAARREYELGIEAEARKRVEEANREDLAALRAELRTLRESLERLTGGEVLVERFALRAQSTRMRTLAGTEAKPRGVPADRRGIAAGEPATVDAATELMARLDIPTTPPPQATKATSTSVPREPQQSTRVVRPVSRQQQAAIQTQRAAPVPDDAETQSWPVAEPLRPAAQQVRRPRPVQQQARPDRPPEPQPRPARPPEQQQPRPGRPPQARSAEATQQVERPWPTPGDAGLSARLGGPVPQPPPDRRRPAEPAPPQVRQAVRPQRVEAVGRSRHMSNERPVETTGGHRRVEQPAGATTSGHRAKVDEPARWQEDDSEITGAHTAGRSVTEILAAHAPQEDAPRHHRRRAD